MRALKPGRNRSRRQGMATASKDADAEASGKVKVKVQAEFWIDPLDHLPLGERRAILLAGGKIESPGSFPMCGIDAALKQVTPRLLLEVFMGELACALKPLSVHSCREQIVTESSSRCDLKNGQSSGTQLYDDTFAARRSVDILNNEDAGAGCDEMVLSMPNHIIKVKVEPSDDSVHRDACIPNERETNVTTETEQRHVEHISRPEQCKLSLLSSITGGCSQVGVSLEPNCCSSSLAEARSITTVQGRSTPICYSEAAYQEDLSSHVQGMSENAFSFLENDVMKHGADKLNDGNANVETEFPSEKYACSSSEVNTANHLGTSINDIPEIYIASSPCVGVEWLSSIGVNNQYGVSWGASNLQSGEGCNDINSDGACDADNMATVAGLKRQSSLKANEWLSDSILSTDPLGMKHKFGNNYSLSGENAAKRLRTSTSMYQENYTPKRDCEVLLDACIDNFSSNISNFLDKDVQSPAVGQTERQSQSDCLLSDSSLPSSVVMVKVETADEGADAQFSVTDTLRESCLLHPSPNTQVASQASICQGNIPFVVHKLQGNREHGGTCSQETFPNHRKEALVAEREVNFGAKSQVCVSALSFSHARVKVEATEEISNNQVPAANAANDLCGSVICSQQGSAIWSRGNSSEENCHNQEPEANDANNVGTSVFDSRETFAPVNPCTVAEMKDASYKEDVPSANDFQVDDQCTMFSCGTSEDMLVTVKSNNCSNIGNQSLVGAFSSFPGKVKIEPLEEIHAVCSSETTTAGKFGTLTSDSSNKFEVAHCQATLCSTEGNTMQSEKNHGHVSTSDNIEQLEERCANIISKNIVGILNSPYSSRSLILKSEPVVSSIQNLYSNALGSSPRSDVLLVGAKSEIVDELPLDILDHMPLTERTKMLAASMVSELKPARKSRCFKQTRVHAVGCDSVDSQKLKAKRSTHRRKRKKTATDSVEIALEEDAPGLLQGLLDRGINLDEIKLYGCEEDVEALDISSNEDGFEDLEAVISKLFAEGPTSLFKLAPLRSAKGAKAVYCLACLISLIEQTRYLQFRSCPVEWGWCRDLQSFVFVFKMHNRIVLERPEYGYATYFFELVESFPIDWQIKRLVTAMKLTSCSRAMLIENKSLLVGVDVSEGEAHVLEEYGWLPNTGLGSMLNYCDRVVHDRNAQDTSEWRQKIGKLLMDGYDGGRIVKADLPKKVIDYVGDHHLEIKMET